MTVRLDGTVALVTGASSGIGRAIAIRLAAQGSAVAIVARRRDRLESLAGTIESAGGRALIVERDIAAAPDAAAVVEEVVAGLGRLDVLVNAAGAMLIGDSIAAPVDDWERMIDVNLKALLYVTKAALPHLLAGVGSSPRRVTDVVNISSTAGRMVGPYAAVYHATKFGVTAATESWRQEYTSRGVRFSVIEPGAVDTELGSHQAGTQAWYDETFADREMLQADDIAATVEWIVSNPRRVAVNEVVIRPTDQI